MQILYHIDCTVKLTHFMPLVSFLPLNIRKPLVFLGFYGALKDTSGMKRVLSALVYRTFFVWINPPHHYRNIEVLLIFSRVILLYILSLLSISDVYVQVNYKHRIIPLFSKFHPRQCNLF